MDTDWTEQVILERFKIDILLPGNEEAYRAWDNLTNQVVKLHLLPILPINDTGRLLESNGSDLSGFSHPDVAPYLGYFEYASHGFWVEGFLDAPSLRDILSSIPGQPLQLTESLVYLKALSAGLAALHSAGWAHANLCPENIRITRKGRVQIFGLFSARRLGEIPPCATRYTPPDRALSPAYDVYSLGRILFEMLGGSLPEPLPDLRSLNPRVPEYLARQLPRALDAYPNTRVADPTELFQTACLACRMDATSIPDRIPLDSASAFSLGVWEYLPILEHPNSPKAKVHPIAASHVFLQKGKSVQPKWLWPTIAIAGLGIGLIAWFLIAWFKPTDAAQVDIPGTQAAKPSAPALIATQALSPSPTTSDGLNGKIVFTCTRSEINQLCLITPAGGEITRLTSETAQGYYPALSAAGNLLIYASNVGGSFDLYLKPFDTSAVPTRLTTNVGEVAASAFSPDGSQIIFSNSVNGKIFQLWQVGREGGDAHQLYSTAGNISSAAWAPNGQNIALTISSLANTASYDIYILNLETQNIAQLTKGELSNIGGSVDWSPDGRSLVIFAGAPGDKNIFLVDTVSGQTTQLTSGGNNAAPAFSPDGNWIVFNSQRTGNADIFIMKADGTDVRQLTTDPQADWQPRWAK